MRMGFCVAVVGGCLLLYTSGANALFCYVVQLASAQSNEEPLDQRSLASPKSNAFLFLERKERKAKTILPRLRECFYTAWPREKKVHVVSLSLRLSFC